MCSFWCNLGPKYFILFYLVEKLLGKNICGSQVAVGLQLQNIPWLQLVDFHGPRTMRPFLVLVAMKVAVVLRRHFNVVPQINDQRFSRQSEVFGPFLIWQKDAFVTLRTYHCVTTNVTRAKNTAREFFCRNGQTESCVKF